MNCTTSKMRTNQERNHPGRFLHEVSGGATCDQECQRQHSDRILNDLLVMIDGGNNAVLVLLDLSAAFDTY